MRSNRQFYLALFLLVSSLLGYGYYLQFVDGLNPCPLCIFQRVAYIAIIAIGIIAFVHNPQRPLVWFYDGLILLSAGTGAAIAGRQVRLQHLPADRIPECGPGLDFMLEVFPFAETLKMVFTGSGECAAVDWTFLGLSIAEWSLIWFILIGAACVVHILAVRRSQFADV